MIGETLGHYRILEKLGEGGMGEVYLAEDEKLNRKVALKVLPSDMAKNEERRKRFEREAKAVAALNHPNIVILYSVEEADRTHFITMEVVRGETLTALIGKKGVSLDKFLEIAIPLADAVSAAHQEGITHRDLKPDNLMLTEGGRLKILDFGLAKLGQAEPTSAINELPTRSATQEGHIVGTVAYMSPEQAEGKQVDARSDIFSMGIVLYELATGQRPFEGGSAASILAAILMATPAPVTEIDASLPRDLARILRRCLAKDPERRYQTAKDVRNDLEDLRQEVDSGRAFERAAPSLPREGRRRALPWGLAGLLTLLALTSFMLWRANLPEPPTVRRFVIQPPGTAPLRGWRIAVSPDGSRVVYRAALGETRRLYVRRLDELEARPLPGTEGVGLTHFFSPDGEWIAFVADSKLKKISLSGSAPITLCETPSVVLGGSWSPDGIIFFGGINLGLWRVPDEGGEPEAVRTPDEAKGELDWHFPEVLPGGEAALFTLHSRMGTFRIEALSLSSGERNVLIEDGFDAKYVRTGHIVYGRGNALFAAPFDLERLEVTGSSVRMLDNLNTQPNSGWALFHVANDGTLVYVPEPSLDGRRLVWVDRHGTEELLPLEPRAFNDPRLSPNGDRVAVTVRDRDRWDIWVYDLEKDTENRLTFEGLNENPVWSPDGKRLAFSSVRGGSRDIYWKPVDGAGGAEPLLASELRLWPGSFSPDGSTLAFIEADPTDRGDIGLLRIDSGTSKPFVKTTASNWDPRFSPDGRWIALWSRYEIYVIPYPGAGGMRQISTEGGNQAIWGPDGREIFYRQAGRVIAVPIRTTPTFEAGKPEVLFEDRYVTATWSINYDVAHDGRFLMVKRSEDELQPRPIHVVLNWTEELKRRVPAN